MKIMLALLAIFLVLNYASAQSEPRKKLEDLPKYKIFGGKNGQPYYRLPTSSYPENEVLKGEYVCGNKICILEPDVEPQGCGGRCQYPVKHN